MSEQSYRQVLVIIRQLAEILAECAPPAAADRIAMIRALVAAELKVSDE